MPQEQGKARRAPSHCQVGHADGSSGGAGWALGLQGICAQEAELGGAASLLLTWVPAQFDEAGEDKVPNPWWWSRKFWLGWAPAILTACLIVIGIVMIVWFGNVTAVYFDVRPALRVWMLSV